MGRELPEDSGRLTDPSSESDPSSETLSVSENSSDDATRPVNPLGVASSSSVDLEAALLADLRGHGDGLSGFDRVDLLVAEMAAAWGRGERPPAEVFLAREPGLEDDPEAAIRLIDEEIRLRRQTGLEVDSADFVLRFPRWASELIGLIDRGYPSGPADFETPMPEVGQTLGEFLLLANLGRGVRGRVYLASQRSLGDRPVVLKVTPRDGREHLSLARLQHPHVVPLYGVVDLAERDLRVLCMPYLGGTTLSKLMALLRKVPVGRRSGRDLLDRMDRVQAGYPRSAPSVGPARRFLERASYPQAICGIGACLADALGDAHRRGLVHLDVKPSNVLLAADGTPMLLDFHLAQAPMGDDGPPPHRVGGTPPYMSPEQRAALAEARSGQPVRSHVDGRCDIYALGVLLLEALGGQAGTGPDGPSARQIRRRTGVGVGLSDVLARCLASDPSNRYQDASLLAVDLRRHLADLPLRGVPNRSPAERWRKWRRRHPQAATRAVASAAALAAALAVGLVAVGDVRRRLDGAEAALAEGRRHLDEHAVPEASRALTRGEDLIARPFPLDRALARARDTRRALGEQVRRAQRAKKVEELHALVDRLRLLYGADVPEAQGLVALRPRLEAAWGSRGRLLDRPRVEADRGIEPRLRADLLDLGILWADLRVRMAPASDANAARREALAILGEAEALVGSSPILERERQSLAESLGLADVAREAARRASEREPGTAWEHYALGRALLAEEDWTAAVEEFARAVELQPQDLWSQFSRGVCAYRLGRFADAVAAFDICVALAPQMAELYDHRGRAHAARDDAESALRDFDRALKLDPSLGPAALDRGILNYREGRYAEAIADFRRALGGRVNAATAHHDLALAHLARGDRDAALEDVRHALRSDPNFEGARALERRLRGGPPGAEAAAPRRVDPKGATASRPPRTSPISRSPG